MKISLSYLREPMTNYHGYDCVLEWLEEYCARNKINASKINHVFRDGSSEPYISVAFKSQQQMNSFLRIGQGVFPYFEFL